MNIAELAVDGIEQFGEYESWHFEEQWHTNVQILECARQMATVLAEHGVKAGDRVVVIMMSCMEVPKAFHAIARLGAVAVPIMPQLIPREINYIVENSGAEVVITSPMIAPNVAAGVEGIPGFREILTFGDSDVPGTQNIAAEVEAAAPHDGMYEADEDELAVIIYTSGTTGNPKGVMLTHGNLVRNIKTTASIFHAPPRERSLMVLPMSHVYGMMLVNISVLLGGQTFLLAVFDPEKVLQTIQDHKIERCSLVPAMQVALIHHPAREKYDTSSLKYVTAGSAPLTEEVRSTFGKLYDCRVTDGYGQSEATCVVSGYTLEQEPVPGSAGPAIPGVELCILDDDNTPLPPGKTGEICVRGPNVMKGYWKNEEATNAAIIDGWLHSGDVGHLDENGYVFITDRKKDMIIKGGENISPREIEEAIVKLPQVAEVSVYAVPDEKFQEEIAATVVPMPGSGVTEDQIRDAAAEHVTKFKIPKYVTFTDALPRNANGKILKRTLRDKFQEASQDVAATT